MSSIILARHGNADRIICVNDPYDDAYSTKDDETDLRVQGNTSVPNIYMKLGDSFPSARAFSTLLCSISNKRRLQNLIRRYLTDLATSVDAEIIYSVGSDCTNLSTSLKLTLFSSLLMQFCESLFTLALLSLMPLIRMPMSQQHSSHSSCLVCSVLRESKKQSSAVTRWQIR